MNETWIERMAQVLGLNVSDLQAVRAHRRLKQKEAPPCSLRQFLIARRLQLHLTQSQVGQRVGFSYTVISDIEGGKIIPSEYYLERFVEALECKIPSGLLPLSRDRTGRFRKERSTPLGNFVRQKRLGLGLTQVQLARRGRTSQVIISAVESGRYIPGPMMMKKISTGLGCAIPADLLQE